MYIRSFVTENAIRGWYKRAPLTQCLRRSWHENALFTENAKRGWYKEALLTQYVRLGLAQKRSFC